MVHFYLPGHFLVHAVPLTPKSDQHLHLISPQNITLESRIKVTRLKETTPNQESFNPNSLC